MRSMLWPLKSEIQLLTEYRSVKLYVKRDDLLDPFVSGNKLYKLKLNAAYTIEHQFDALLTFGGAYSNHIAATASYGRKVGIQTIGIIRGEAASISNPTLRHASENGMRLEFVSRADYRQKHTKAFLDHLKAKYPNSHVIPEGGANKLGIDGAGHMLNSETAAFDYITVAMGTGTSFAGICEKAQEHQVVIGFPIHKHSQLLEDILKVHPSFNLGPHRIINGFHFGGYAKYTEQLIDFMRSIHQSHGLKLDPIYTGKALKATFDQIDSGQIPANSSVLFIHTGGLQGNCGFEERHGFSIYQ